jgi:alkanesulfonate monooxygenase SsuD/methylene tetrahydromethanopterin reductase-like flavin-dependent oxidoreductase (luciferase family)
MRFSLIAPFTLGSDLPGDINQKLAWCVRAEQLGYEAVWLVNASTPSGGASLTALVFAAALAASTHRLRIGLVLEPQEVSSSAASEQVFRIAQQLAEGRMFVDQRLEDARLVRRVVLAASEREAQRLAQRAELGLPGQDDALIGDVETVAAKLRQLEAEVRDADLLLDFFAADMTGNQTTATSSIERFSREIMPRFSPQPLLPPTFA